MSAPARRTSHLLTLTGVLGEIFITVGVLLGLFVVWQLWWTDVIGNRAQDQIVAGLDWQEPLPVVTSPADVPDPADTGGEPVQYRTPAPVIDEPDHATTFAVLYVPRWSDRALPMSEGTSKHDVLDALGIGHYEHTAMPGAIGNFAVAGHRTTYGKPFNRVEELTIDDPLVVRTADTWYVYRITSTEVVQPWETDVISPVPDDASATPTDAMMTMTTCHPMFSARERFVVHALLDYWVPADEGTPVELTGADLASADALAAE